MAVLGKVSAYSPTRRGAGIRNIGRGLLDLATSPLGALGVDIDPNYEGNNAEQWEQFSQIGDSIGKTAGGIGLGMATSGLSGLLAPSVVSKYGGKIYGKKGKKYFALGGMLEGDPVKNPTDAQVYKQNAGLPKQGVLPNSNVRFLPNGDITPIQLSQDTYVPPTPEEIARVMAETQAQALVQEQGLPQQKKYGGIMKNGGSLLTEYQGNTHEDGGIPIDAENELEDKENSFNMKDGSKYIFSNSIFMDNSKRTYAQGARKIANKYKLREGDAMAKTAQERELGQLSQKQEFVKGAMNPQQGVYDEGGYLNTMFDKGGYYDNPLTKNWGSQSKWQMPTYLDTESDIKAPADEIANVSPYKSTPTQGYKPSYGVPMAGYGVQTLSNLPALFAKPNKVNFQRVTPETVDLSSQRDEARRNRNLQLAMAQKQAGQMGNASQAGAYANAATSGITGNYGDAFNQSMMQQQGANVGIRNQANAQNAEIQMREQIARQQEEDAVRSAKQQAIMNMGQAIAGAGQTYQQMGQEGNYLNAMSAANPDYGLNFSNGNFWTPQTITPYRKRKCGGKIGRKV